MYEEALQAKLQEAEMGMKQLREKTAQARQMVLHYEQAIAMQEGAIRTLKGLLDEFGQKGRGAGNGDETSSPNEHAGRAGEANKSANGASAERRPVEGDLEEKPASG